MTTTKSDKEITEKKAVKAPAKPKATAEKAVKAPKAAPKKAETTAEKAVSMKDVASSIAQGMTSGQQTEGVGIAVKPTLPKDRYQFATGRRKTAVANVRMFSGKGENLVNRKPFTTYFLNPLHQNQALRPLEVTGLGTDFYFTSTINGGGINAQSQALRHGLAQALAALNDDIRKILKKNAYLTRDDRKKERKKPGLRGARRAPQWAKR